jgi:ADP-heptose:LPS heptosyltransferase
MRIVIHNSDAMGDLVLRQPLLAALADAGHELTVLVNPAWLPLARLAAPTAEVITIPVAPRRPETFGNPSLAALIRRLRAAQPDWLIVPTWWITPLDVHLADALPGAAVLSFAGARPCQAGVPPLRCTRPVQAEQDDHAWLKNRRLAEALLGSLAVWPLPRLTAAAAQLELARAALGRLNLTPPYWIASVAEIADHRKKHLRNWHEHHWVEVIRRNVVKHGSRWLLIGTPEEQVMTRRIAPAVDAPGSVLVLNESDEGLDLVIGVTALARGYVGRDTGPLHLAAALDKPVLALYGGGTWPRFTPQARQACVLTVEAPCRGCGWNCHLSDSHCVKSIPIEAVHAGLDELEQGLPEGVQIRMLPRTPHLVAQMEAEAHAGYRDVRERLKHSQRERLALENYAQRMQRSVWWRLGRALRLAKPASRVAVGPALGPEEQY